MGGYTKEAEVRSRTRTSNQILKNLLDLFMQVTREKLNEVGKTLNQLEGQIDLTKSESNRLIESSKALQIELEVLDEVNKFFTEAMDQRIDEVKHKVEDIINQGIAYVYKTEDLKIQIGTTFKNNKTQFVINLVNGDMVTSKVTESFGGGLIAIVAFLFKVVVNIVYKNEKVFFFDETLNYVSKHYQESLSEFIKKLCEDMDMTVILITHQPLLAEKADMVYEAYESSKGTKFKLLTT